MAVPRSAAAASSPPGAVTRRRAAASTEAAPVEPFAQTPAQERLRSRCEAAVVASTSCCVALALARAPTPRSLSAEAVVLCALTALALWAEERGWGARALRGLQARPAAPPGLPLGCVALVWCFAARCTSGGAAAALPAFWGCAAAAAAALGALGAGAVRGRPSPGAAAAAAACVAALHTLFGAATPAAAFASAASGCAAAGGAWALLRALPRSATAGESLLAAQGVAAAACAFARHVAAGGPLPPGSEVDVAALALVLAPLAAASAAAAAASAARGSRPTLRLLPLLAAAATLACFHAATQRALRGTPPLTWLLRFMLAAPARRLGGVAAWSCLAGAPLPALRGAARAHAAPRILLRKAFHVIAAAAAAPAAAADPELLRVAFAAAFAAFCLAEGARVGRVPRLGPAIHALMAPFADHRDSGVLLLSHFSLLLGVAAPLWLSQRTAAGTAAPLPAWAGVVALGAGDVAASAVGHAARGRRVLPGWPKTWAGTAAGAAASAAAALAAASMADTTGGAAMAGRVVAAATASAALEAVTAQLDNAFVPMQLFALLALA